MDVKILLALPFLLLTVSCAGDPANAGSCGQPGEWRAAGAPATTQEGPGLLDRMARQQVVLLGEQHDSAEDHRWQLHTLAQLHSRQPRVALGLEMFPRRLQPVLDEWVAGKLAEDDFLRKTEWEKVWGYDARDYLPLFHYARMNRLPMLALNVERSLPEAIGKLGWDAVPEPQKEGLTRPAAPTEAYRKELRKVFDHHPAKEKGESSFPRFVEAQTAWDRAMAQAIAEFLGRTPDALMVAILGAGHVRHGYGVEHQLKDLGIGRVGKLMTWDHSDSCNKLDKGMADALYVVEEPKLSAPRLGVATNPEAGGLRIMEITAGSVAESAGLQKGDLIVAIAGQPARGILTLRQAVQRQPPGTWLPLKVKRGDAEIEILARFPAEK